MQVETEEFKRAVDRFDQLYQEEENTVVTSSSKQETEELTTVVTKRQKKNKKVAWFVSNCNAKNSRLNYAKRLAKYIQVTKYLFR